jgi:enoyl reductase-like protein
MRQEGLPVEGFCVAARIPSTEKAAENPDIPIILQWTGGYAGEHHSFEDFHQAQFPFLKRADPSITSF